MSQPSRSDQRTRAALGIEGAMFSPFVMRSVRAAVGNTIEQVWQGVGAFPVLPSGVGALTATSDTATDTAGGVGAQVLTALYLNRSREIRLGFAVMAGVGVATFMEFDVATGLPTAIPVGAVRLLAVDIDAVGAGGENSGIITIDIAGVNQARIPRAVTGVTQAMFNRARPGFTVPTGFCVLVDSFGSCFHGTEAGPPATPIVAMQARSPEFGGLTPPWSTIAACEADSPLAQLLDPITLTAGTDIRFVYESTALAEPTDALVMPVASLYLHPSDRGAQDSDPNQIPPIGQCGFGSHIGASP